jgi:hypothetical protein
MPKRVARRVFGNPSPPNRLMDRPLNDRFVQMVAMPQARPPVDVVGGSRKHPLPSPLAVRVRELAKQRIRQRRPAQSCLQIRVVLLAYLPQMVLERLVEHLRQHGHAILLSFAAPDGDFPPAEVEVLDAHLETFEESQPGTVQQRANQAWNPIQVSQYGLDLVARQYDR